jgi:hypothetical protein
MELVAAVPSFREVEVAEVPSFRAVEEVVVPSFQEVEEVVVPSFLTARLTLEESPYLAVIPFQEEEERIPHFHPCFDAKSLGSK